MGLTDELVADPFDRAAYVGGLQGEATRVMPTPALL